MNGPVEPDAWTSQWQSIVEMIDASMQLAVDMGPHPETVGCNCIVCVNTRKRSLFGSVRTWRYHL